MSIEVMEREEAKELKDFENLREPEQDAVRNSGMRKLTEPFDPIVGIFKRAGFNGNHLTVMGAAASMSGVHLIESQHRAGKYKKSKIFFGCSLVLLGMLCDGMDGKLARRIRNGMTDEKARKKDRLFGNWIDPAIDGIKETFQLADSAWTSFKLGHPAAAYTALFSAATVNKPREEKAKSGEKGRAVPENYNITDFRFWGTSLGRNANVIGTIFKHPLLRETIYTITATANLIVAQERHEASLKTDLPPTLSENKIEEAQYRANRLAIQSKINLGLIGLGAVAGFAYMARQRHKRNGKFS